MPTGLDLLLHTILNSYSFKANHYQIDHHPSLPFCLRTHKSVLITHFSPSSTSLPSCYAQVNEVILKCKSGGTYKHTFVTMPMKQTHTRLQSDYYLLLNDIFLARKIVGVENRLTTNASSSGGGQI